MCLVCSLRHIMMMKVHQFCFTKVLLTSFSRVSHVVVDRVSAMDSTLQQLHLKAEPLLHGENTIWNYLYLWTLLLEHWFGFNICYCKSIAVIFHGFPPGYFQFLTGKRVFTTCPLRRTSVIKSMKQTGKARKKLAAVLELSRSSLAKTFVTSDFEHTYRTKLKTHLY